MSWEATAWAMNQRVGNPGRKLLLLALANYADENGVCWPSQGRLAVDTEASLDTIQRQTKKLVADGLLTIERSPKRRGQWQTFRYRLAMAAPETRPQNAARPESRQEGACPADKPPPADALGADHQRAACQPTAAAAPNLRLGRAATSPSTGPQTERPPGRTAMRPKPSIEPSIEPPKERSRARTATDSVARHEAWRREGSVEVVQNRIARRLGPDGWSVLMELSEAELSRLTELERMRRLSDETLQHALLEHRALQARNQSSGPQLGIEAG